MNDKINDSPGTRTKKFGKGRKLQHAITNFPLCADNCQLQAGKN
jgi:hypothetical protein